MRRAIQIRNSSGMGMVEVLMAIAVLGAIMATATSMYSNMVEMERRAVRTTQIDNFMKALQDQLTLPGVCDGALRTAANTPIVWAGGAVAVGRILIPTVPATAYQVGTDISPLQNGEIVIQAMRLRNPTPGDLSEGSPVGPNPFTDSVGVNYNTYYARLEITFTVLNTSGGGMRPRSIPLSIARRAVAPLNQIDYCFKYPMAQYNAYSLVCNAANLAPGEPDCCPATANCKPHYVIKGYLPNGQPNCICERLCFNSPGPGASPPPPGC